MESSGRSRPNRGRDTNSSVVLDEQRIIDTRSSVGDDRCAGWRVSDSKERWSLSIDFFSLAMETTGSRVWNQSVRASYDEWSNRFRELFDLFSTPNELERHSVNRDALNWTETSKPVNQLFLLVFIVRVVRRRGRIQYEIYYGLI